VVSPFYVQLDWWWQLKKKQAFSVRLCGFESGYADKHRAREKRRGTSMAIRLNQEAVGHAQNLIKGRPYERNSDWSEAQASAEEENRFIDENDREAFANWFLAYGTEASEKGPRVATAFPLGTSGSYIAATSSPPNNVPVPKTTTRSKGLPTSCLRSCKNDK
jgi:hypothetical protein